MRFLVVEDNIIIGRHILCLLKEQYYDAVLTASGREAEQLVCHESFDLIILDVLLPDYDGIQFCRNLRRRKITTPILMLTALSSTQDKVEGLNAGADDYLIKPFESDELLARVRALLRRWQSTEASTLRLSGLEMNLLSRQVTRDGNAIELTSREFALLEYFLRNPDRVLTRSNIGERVWGVLFEGESNVIEVYVSRLRRKIDRRFEKPLIHTMIGYGYVLSADRHAGHSESIQ